MKRKNIILLGCLIALCSCGTNWGYIDSGLADGRIKGNMYQYLQSDSYNWDSIRKIIDRAGMTQIFEGKDPAYPSITFFGPTNHSIRKWMYDQKPRKNVIEDITVDSCKMLVKMHMLNKKILRDEFPRGVSAGSKVGEGGEIYTMENGNKVWIYSFREKYDKIPDAGPVSIYTLGIKSGISNSVVSSDIQSTNGVVQALSYTYRFGLFY